MKKVAYALLLTGSPILLGCSAGQPDPNLEANRALVQQYCQTWNTGQVADLDHILASDFIDHSTSRKDYKGIAPAKEYYTKTLAATAQPKDEIVDMVAQGDRVAVRYRSAGIYRGQYKGVEATGKQFVVYLAIIYRIAGGKIAEEWDFGDEALLDKQLLPAK